MKKLTATEILDMIQSLNNMDSSILSQVRQLIDIVERQRNEISYLKAKVDEMTIQLDGVNVLKERVSKLLLEREAF